MIDRTQGTRVLTVILLVVGLALGAASAASGRSQQSSAQSQWILFTAIPGGVGAEQIFRINLSGKGLKQLTKGTYGAAAPTFSPDGKRFAFARLGGGIFSMNVDGTGLRHLTNNGRDSSPAWSPDGTQIAFLRPTVKGWRVFVMSASGAGERRLRMAPAAGRPSWTPGGLVIPTSDGDLAKIDPRSGRVEKRFGALIDAFTGLSSTVAAPDLSAITFVGSRPPIPGDKDCGDGVPCPRFALYIEDLRKQKTPRILARDAGPGAFSHDGKNLAFVARNRIFLWLLKNGTSKSFKTGTVDPSTSAPPAWQPR
jgi:dipeptidyl aminopeptidase/acylaminoacyl peptidase